jgi:MFS family permease
MSFIMTATPVHMHGSGFDLNQTALVIQSHIIAMYLPSLISGFLQERFGLLRTLVAGALLMLGCTVIAIFSREFFHYWGALVLLGLGWNLLFVGGTVLLTSTYRANEGFKAQAANDFTVFGVQALASLSAGSMIYLAGWQTVNVIGLAVIGITLMVLVARRTSIRASYELAGQLPG